MINLEKYEDFIIWGACTCDDLPPEQATCSDYAIKRLLRLLEDRGQKHKIRFLVDRNPALQHKKYSGYDILSPARILEYPQALVIINTISYQAVQASIREMGILNDYALVPYYFYHGIIERMYDKEVAKQVIEKHAKEIKELYCTADEITNRYLDIIFKVREKAVDQLYLPEFYSGTGENLMYFCDPELAPRGAVSYIDVGAFQGETIEPIRRFYGQQLKKCLAFEPDHNSYSKLQEYIVSHQLQSLISAYPYALGNENKEIYFIFDGLNSQQTQNGENAIEQVVFDQMPFAGELVGNVMIKMDIEGAEMSALQGMAETIRQHQPYLAICLYHKEEDIYEIPAYLKSLYPDYRFYLRGGWHLECWAVPERHFHK